MTKYETWAIILSVVAILIPIIQWIWNKWIVRPVLKFYPTGRAYLFVNKSGSYIRVEGVYEALKKSISIKNISLKAVRKKDDATLNLRWSTFLNPANQQILGAVASVSEIAHPFRIDADNVVCAFTEFSDFYGASEKTLQPSFDAIINDLNQWNFEGKTYSDALKEYCELESYINAKEAFKKEFFWTVGKYSIILFVEYGNNKKEFRYNFDVTKENYLDLVHNMDEVLLVYIKNLYKVSYDFKTVQVELEEDK